MKGHEFALVLAVAIPTLLLLQATIAYAVLKVIFRNYLRLARHFPPPADRAMPTKWIPISPLFGKLKGPRNSVEFAAVKDGFYLVGHLVFRFGRTPLFVRWEQVSMKSVRFLWLFTFVELSFEGVPDIKMRWYPGDWTCVKTLFSDVWPQHLK